MQDAETGFYYLQSRYYDPKISRFISPDDFPSTGQGILGNNMFAYCGNNPVIRTDVGGDLWDTVFDVVSLCVSFVEVVNNPADISAWVSLTGDAVDVLVPFVSGVGEATRLFRAADVAGDIHEAVKTSDRAEEAMELLLDGACFIAGTAVLTEDGPVPIESIRTGDLVWAWDEESGDVALKKVVETYINKTDELIHVFVNGEEIVTTPTHPFYSPTKGWTDAVKLRAGDILQLVNGEYVVVEKIQHEILEAPVIVYNFQVEDYHTYFVGKSKILVHNSCAKGPGFDENQQAVIALAKEYKNGISKQEAEILVEWANEYGISAHLPMTHPNRSGYWSDKLHIKILNRHIAVFE